MDKISVGFIEDWPINDFYNDVNIQDDVHNYGHIDLLGGDNVVDDYIVGDGQILKVLCFYPISNSQTYWVYSAAEKN